MTTVENRGIPSAPTEVPDGPTPRRVAIASSVGATIEWYDFFLYGTAAGLVFDKLFFNGLDGPAAQFAAFGTFAVGFLARPVGGLIFGHFGDRVGRKQMLILTLLIMGVGTALIGLLPSYDQIGVWAPILLIVLRVLQGIGVGGEYGGAVLLAVEYAPPAKRGFYGSAAHIGVPGGLFLASGAFSIASLLPDEAFLAWGWRACFVLSILLLAIGAYIRLQVMETPAFARVQERKEVSRVPLRDQQAAQPKRLLHGKGTRYVEGFTDHRYSVNLLDYVVTNLELPKQWALNGILVGSFLGVLLVPLSGALSDRLG
ncbi:MAG: MFS transporter, partial [Marmoricola sp.]